MKDNKLNDNKKRAKKRIKKIVSLKNVMMVVGTLIILIFQVYQSYIQLEQTDQTMQYLDFWECVDEGKIDNVRQIASENYMIAEDTDGVTYRVVDPKYEDFRKDMLEHGVKVEVSQQTFSKLLSTLMLSLPLQIAMYLFIVNFCFSNIMTTGNMFKVLKPETVITFDDIAGMSETKEEVKFAVAQLKNADKLQGLGAKPCKGIILSGPPGTGKTMLARAIAGESGVPLISCSGSDFIEMFVGLGAARVRSLWELAELNAPCVVFIDEIDCLGRRRSGAQNSENNQTLNALLQKMDGVDKPNGILVIGATNRIDDLDTALLRPGRFDKQLYVGKPRTKKDRDELIGLYLKDKKTEKDVTVESISKHLRGFSGAEIAETMNEAVMISLMDNRDGVIQIEDVNKAAMKLIAHGVSVKHTSERDRQISAIHEAGHAVMNILVGNKVGKVSIESYSSGIGGYTVEDTDNKEDLSFRFKSDLLNDVRVLLAGMISEDIKYGEHSNGCSNDLERASVICYNLIDNYGMNDNSLVSYGALKKFGVQLIDSDDTVEKANKLLLELKEEVYSSLKEHYNSVEKLANQLLEEEVVLNFDPEELKKSESIENQKE